MSDHTNDDRLEAIQAVVDRIGSYQDGAPEGTVEAELRRGLADADVTITDEQVVALAAAVEENRGHVDVRDVVE